MTKEEREELTEMRIQIASIKTMVEAEYGTPDKPGNIALAIRDINKKVGKIYTLLYGNGDVDKSIVVQLALVKKDVKRAMWGVGIVFVGFIGSIIKMFLS